MTLHTRPKRKGAVLITVMVVIVVLLLIGYQYLNLMLAEGNASIVSGRLAQARHLADSGVHYANFVLAFPQTQNLSDSPDSFRAWYGNIYDNSDIFHYRPVNGLNGAVKGYFTIVSPRDPLDTSNTTGYRFGVEDENGKINLNAIRQMIKKDTTGSVKKFITSMIQAIPNIDPEVATAVINWTQEGGTPDTGESAYYSSLGYQSKAGPYDSTDELLMVKGWTPQMLYGNDKNRNGKLDPDEDDGSAQVNLGYQRYFTVYSRELNVDSTGTQRININSTDLATLKTQLDASVGEEISTYILLARTLDTETFPITLQGPALLAAQPLPNGITVSGGKFTFDFQKARSKRTFPAISPNPLLQKSLFSFTDTLLAYRPTPAPNPRIPLLSPFQTSDNDKLRTNLTALFDKCTLVADYEIPARININTCPADVLATLNVNSTDAEKLVELRPTPDMDPTLIPYYLTPAWLVTEGKIASSTLNLIANYITTYSQVYRFQVVGYFEFRGPQVRLEVVVDANNGRPRILYWRDLTDLGKGYNFSTNRGGQ